MNQSKYVLAVRHVYNGIPYSRRIECDDLEPLEQLFLKHVNTSAMILFFEDNSPSGYPRTIAQTYSHAEIERDFC